MTQARIEKKNLLWAPPIASVLCTQGQRNQSSIQSVAIGQIVVGYVI